MIQFFTDLFSHLPTLDLAHVLPIVPFMFGTISAGSTILASDVIASSAGAADAGKIPKTNGSGVLDASFVVKPTLATGQATRDVSLTSALAIAHGLGVTPRLVKITVIFAGNNSISHAYGVYSGGSAKAHTLAWDKGSGSNTLQEQSLKVVSQITATEQSNTITIAAPDATNINLTFSKSGTPTGTADIIWEVYE